MKSICLLSVMILGLVLTSCGEEPSQQQAQEPLNRTPPSGDAQRGIIHSWTNANGSQRIEDKGNFGR